jgi:hypothetical protein
LRASCSGRSNPEVHAAEGLGLERVPGVARDVDDDIRAANVVHEQKSDPAEDGIAVLPPATELVGRDVQGNMVQTAEGRAGGMADNCRPFGVADDGLKRMERAGIGHGLQCPDEVVQLLVGQVVRVEAVKQAGRPSAVGGFGNLIVGYHRGSLPGLLSARLLRNDTSRPSEAPPCRQLRPCDASRKPFFHIGIISSHGHAAK